MSEYKFSKKDIIQDDLAPIKNLESDKVQEEKSDDKSQKPAHEHCIYESDLKNQNHLYDICSFGMLALCIYEILYCFLVNYDSYNYHIITYTGLSAIALYLYSNSLKTDGNSKFNYFAYDYLTFNYFKLSFRNTIGIIAKILSCLPIFYPLSIVLIWILSITNIISTDVIQSLPYCFHSNCSGFSIFIMCIIYIAIASKLFELKSFGWSGLLGAVLLYTFFDQKLFDIFAGISGLIGILAIIGVFLWGFIKSGIEAINSQDNSENNSSSDSYNNSCGNSFQDTSSNYKTDLENVRKEVKEEINRANLFNQKQEKVIGSAVQRSSVVEVFDTDGRYLFSKSGELMGFTTTTVSIKRGHTIEVFDERGCYKFSRSCY